MASVKIDLGFDEQAILSERAASGIVTAKHQRDAEEFLRRWPRTRSIHQERDYLRQLRLHVGYNPPGVNPSDASALLRSAVKSGRVMVVIERATKRLGGGGGAIQPTRRSGAIAPSRQSFAEMAAGGSGSSAMLSDAASAPKTYSWMQSYDDVSADDLIKYLESVIASTPATAAAPDAAPPMSLADAQPFGYGEDSASEDAIQLAGGEGTPGNNQAQNRQFKAVVRALGLNQDQARQLHEEISGEGLGYHEMLERGQDMFGGIE